MMLMSKLGGTGGGHRSSRLNFSSFILILTKDQVWLAKMAQWEKGLDLLCKPVSDFYSGTHMVEKENQFHKVVP